MSGNTIYRAAPLQVKPPRKVSLNTFLRKYSKGKPGIKYEYNKGLIEKTASMKAHEQYLVFNLLKHFSSTPSAKQGHQIVQELEIWTSSNQWRKPDLAFLTVEQARAGAQGFEPIPEFIIEVISPNDKINIVKNKVYEYFNAGVKILWQLFPEQQVIEVYRSPEDVELCSGDKKCSAEPIVEGFVLSAADVFKAL
ncbi:MAG TPA: Uma2 family endonuclease [Saprospiraceae bacterium]|nr:Uma2 family endonuclease [Saprospiraceae bacterium]HMQ82423.1 Uma2 family endonuclease [Saprospiraceae bacterium]